MPGRWRNLTAKQRYHRAYPLTIGVIDLLYGGTYAAGGTATSPALLVMQEALPMPVWGLLLCAVGVGVLLRYHQYAGIVGGAVWSAFAITSLMSVIAGTASSAGGPPLLVGVAALHLLVTYGAAARYSDSAR